MSRLVFSKIYLLSNLQVWSDELAREADDWISKCDFKHQQAGRGENIAMNTAMDVNGDIVQAMKDWYDEIKDFNYHGKACFPRSCHYTQVHVPKVASENINFTSRK